MSTTHPVGEDGHELSITLERALHGGYHASWLLFDDASDVVAESPSLPKWYMDYCPNEIVAMLHHDAWEILGIDGDDDALARWFTCTCEDED